MKPDTEQREWLRWQSDLMSLMMFGAVPILEYEVVKPPVDIEKIRTETKNKLLDWVLGSDQSKYVPVFLTEKMLQDLGWKHTDTD